MRNTGGFTLIELIAVIVTLGILVSTAAVKSLSLSSAAKSAVVKSLGASIQSTAILNAMSFYTTPCYSVHNNGAGTIGEVVLHYRQVYSGDWEPRFSSDCVYQGDTALDGLPEIIEALNISQDKIDSYWMLHNRQDPAPLSDALWIAPFPPADKKGIKVVAFNAPATQAQVSELEATNCYVKYATPNSAFTAIKVEAVISGC